MTANENSNLNNWIIQTLQSYKYLSATNQIKSLRKNVIHSIKKLTGFQVKTTIAAGFTQSVETNSSNIYYADHLHTNIYFQWKNRTNFCSNYFILQSLDCCVASPKFFSGNIPVYW